MTFGLLIWGQTCLLPYDLRHQDSIWVESPRTWKALAQVRSLRDARSGLPIRVRFVVDTEKPSLLAVCQKGSETHWLILWRGDTLSWVSTALSPQWLRRNLTLLRGVRTWHPGRPPYKEITLFIPLASRPTLPEDSLWHANETGWLDGFFLPLIQTLQMPPGRITGMGLHLRYLQSGKITYEALSIYVQRHDELPFDEAVRTIPLRDLARPFRNRFYDLLRNAPTYAYVVRIQDYYPLDLMEARQWMRFLREKRELPLPSAIPVEDSPAIGTLPR